MHVEFWLKDNIENAMTSLGPMSTGCCVRSITVTSGTHTNHNQSMKMTNVNRAQTMRHSLYQQAKERE